ncbi:hypothetical protein CMALT430_160173 [Carnobacterium maltaromaticum]|nr:hypothetical protein CMALT430_160173 [Carnobacterium maltaromaticum]
MNYQGLLLLITHDILKLRLVFINNEILQLKKLYRNAKSHFKFRAS